MHEILFSTEEVWAEIISLTDLVVGKGRVVNSAGEGTLQKNDDQTNGNGGEIWKKKGFDAKITALLT